ncbi:MAG: hypothetical protein HY746_07645 [Elusimicrobia bacterium]|nr:hypothetical protein [Elusimicrobiota bacterium]
MKKAISISMIVFAGALAANAFELNGITAKDIAKDAQSTPIDVSETAALRPQVSEAMPTTETAQKYASSPYQAAEQLKEELRLRGVFVNVKVLESHPAQLSVEFPNWETFKKAQDVFATDDHGNLFYMGYYVRPQVPREKIPMNPKDAFKGLDACSIVNAVFAKQPTLKEAVSMLQPCVKAVSKKYGVLVSASESFIWHTGPTISQQRAIGILVSGPLPIGNSVIRDLNHSVEIHHGYLLAYPAYVKHFGEVRTQTESQKGQNYWNWEIEGAAKEVIIYAERADSLDILAQNKLEEDLEFLDSYSAQDLDNALMLSEARQLKNACKVIKGSFNIKFSVRSLAESVYDKLW